MSLTAQLTRRLHQAIGKATSCHILMMGLDRFKNVNDALGQSFGDALLRSVAQRLIAHTGAAPAKSPGQAGMNSRSYWWTQRWPMPRMRRDAF